MTPGAQQLLNASNTSGSWLLAMHCYGLWGEVHEDDARTNEEALKSGARLLSAYPIGDQRIWIITEAADEQGCRHTTTLLMPDEY